MLSRVCDLAGHPRHADFAVLISLSDQSDQPGQPDWPRQPDLLTAEEESFITITLWGPVQSHLRLIGLVGSFPLPIFISQICNFATMWIPAFRPCLTRRAVLCRSVLGWRKWYHKQGGGGFWEASGREATPAPVLTREQLLDRYHQHTQNCPACSKVSHLWTADSPMSLPLFCCCK